MNAVHATQDQVDDSRPWLGLASFSEETRAYFHGRDEEVAELARRVQRKLLTVLFGQSGLGKTSMLRAGLVPRLREQGYCPVYVRLDYAAGAPAPAVQVRRAILAVAPHSGIDAVDGESLWELLHRRNLVLRDAAGQPVAPFLIVDQFEEMFTLAQDDAAGAATATAFVEELAALVENRPPRALEYRIEQDDSLVERFDFGRDDYRVLIALREDYLAHLEQLKGAMPSITQNRMRLAPMNGAQALAAVTCPGGRLVSDEVAQAIVRFVASGAELGHAQVEPSLLSLICRELNEARISAVRSEISLDLLAGSHSSILSDFYERALAGYPAGVRKVVEDVLLTASGFRENVAEERVVHALEAAGAPDGTLEDLVNRRLLRIEERLDIRRVELTHDVLCCVVRASRDGRREREALEEDERALAARQQREAVARRSLVRTRQVAVACATLAIAALGASAYAYLATRRADAATVAARDIQATSDAARREAEQLTAYLMDDFARELSGSSKQQMFVDLGMTVQRYYDALPDIAPNSDTELYRALAQVTYSEALVRQNRKPQARPVIGQAVATLERRHRAMPPAERNDIALANALLVRSKLQIADGNDETALAGALRAVELLSGGMKRQAPSLALWRTYARGALDIGDYYRFGGKFVPAQAWFLKAQAALAQLGGTTLADIPTTLDYVRAMISIGFAKVTAGPAEDGFDDLKSAYELADRVLASKPDHVIALTLRADALSTFAVAHARGQTPLAALDYFALADKDLAKKVDLDPDDIEIRSYRMMNAESWSQLLYVVGEPGQAMRVAQAGLAMVNEKSITTASVAEAFVKLKLLQGSLFLEQRQVADAQASIDAADKAVQANFGKDADPRVRLYFESLVARMRSELAVARGDNAQAESLAERQLAAMPTPLESGPWVDDLRRAGANAYLRDGRLQDAESMLRPTVATRLAALAGANINKQRSNARYFLLYAQILDSLGRREQVAPLIAPTRAFIQAEGVAVNAHPQRHLQLAQAYLTIALASDGEERRKALAAASHHVRLVPANVAGLRAARDVIGLLESAVARSGRSSSA